MEDRGMLWKTTTTQKHRKKKINKTSVFCFNIKAKHNKKKLCPLLCYFLLFFFFFFLFRERVMMRKFSLFLPLFFFINNKNNTDLSIKIVPWRLRFCLKTLRKMNVYFVLKEKLILLTLLICFFYIKEKIKL